MRSAPSLATSLAWIGTSVGGVVMGRLADWYGIRWTVIFGAVSICIGLFISTLGAPWQLYVGHGVFIGLLGNSGLNAPLYVYVSRWFDRRRGSALALISSGGYVAGTIWPPIFERAIAHFGWRTTMMAYGLLVVAAVIPIALLTLRPPPELPHFAGGAADQQRRAESVRLAAECRIRAACAGLVPLLRHHVDAAGASGRALLRPRHFRDQRRSHALARARHRASFAASSGARSPTASADC